MYQRVGASAFKKDLTNIRKLCLALGNQYEQYSCIHVAGTNGKGSTCHMLSSVLQEAGYKVGLYTSPHLKDFRERIRINGEMITEGFVIDFTDKIRPLIEEIQPSFFEITVAMAFAAFAEAKVDVAVVETGLGGRLDSTNIITPVLSVITNIGYDHTDMLGETLPEIAFEKAGIIKPGVPVVIGDTHPKTQGTFVKVAEERQAPILFADQTPEKYEIQSDLTGRFQEVNKHTVIIACQQLNKQGWKINEDAIEKGLANVVSNTGLRGRWEKLGENPLVYCDTAHNAEGIDTVVQNISDLSYDNLLVVFGAAEGKDVGKIVRMFPTAHFYLCKPEVPRGLPVEKLEKFFEGTGIEYSVSGSVGQAYEAAVKRSSVNDLIFVGGSTFVVADLLSYLEG